MNAIARHPRRPHSISLHRVWLSLLLPLIALGVKSETFPDAAAQSAAGYSLDRYTIDSGGSDASGGGFVIRGSIGQPEANALGPATGNNYELSGGFWSADGNDLIFVNGFELP